MATKTRSRSTRSSAISPLVQWVAIGVFATLALLAAFVYFGDFSPQPTYDYHDQISSNG